jgi:hypothetical protein
LDSYDFTRRLLVDEIDHRNRTIAFHVQDLNFLKEIVFIRAILFKFLLTQLK